jgi:motility quorum-sensing regulator/GCU-specific mRNA interferase toxin
LEKRTSHYPLATVKALARKRRVRMTRTAVEGGAAMGFGAPDMADVIAGLTSRNLYKSMTSHADHRVWQDVYHVNTEKGVVYLKLTIIEDLLIVSFKEKDG